MTESARGAGVWWNAVRPFAILCAVILVTAALYAGRAIVAPVTFAALLAFLLSPLVGALERALGRVAAVLLVVVIAFSALGAAGWVLSQQISSLADELPAYRTNISRRIAQIRGATRGGTIDKLSSTAKDVMSEVERPDGAPPKRPAQPVAVRDEEHAASLWRLPSRVAPVAELLVSAALVVALVAFMLARRDEMRNRMFRLVGYDRVTTATRAIDEAFARINQYLLSLSVVNATFGIAVGIGLMLIGLPYALLWGFLAAVLRFIPYVGVWTAASLPILLGLAVFTGWVKPLLVVALFVVLEPAIFLVVEPLLYRRTVGVSDIGLLVAVAFWSWLWGPVGLVMSVPLTVCLVVLGKHVPPLGFLTIMMGEEPVVETHLAYYQRLLAHDQDDAADIAEHHADAHGPEETFDTVLLPALSQARRDCLHDRITDEEAEFVLATTREIVDAVGPAGSRDAAAGARRVKVLGCPVRDRTDETAFQMLRLVLDASVWDLDVASPEILSSEVLTLVRERCPAVVCLGSIAPGGVAQTRHLVKRLRAAFPHLKIVIARWGAREIVVDDLAGLQSVGADGLVTSLADARAQLAAFASLATPAPDTTATAA